MKHLMVIVLVTVLCSVGKASELIRILQDAKIVGIVDESQGSCRVQPKTLADREKPSADTVDLSAVFLQKMLERNAQDKNIQKGKNTRGKNTQGKKANQKGKVNPNKKTTPQAQSDKKKKPISKKKALTKKKTTMSNKFAKKFRTGLAPTNATALANVTDTLMMNSEGNSTIPMSVSNATISPLNHNTTSISKSATMS